jgi:hypothetical protein
MRQTGLASACAATLFALLASSSSLASAGASFIHDPVVIAIRRGHCSRAIAQLNNFAARPDPSHALSLLVGGRMLDEGICTAADPGGAVRYFERSAQLGETQAQLDYATKIGLGQGIMQDYAVAGHACHTAGVDPSGLLPFYSLGYACTVGGVASRLLRTSLPAGSFRLPTQPAVVEFNLGSSEIRVISAPTPQRGSVPLGSIIAPLLVDPAAVITKAFRDALEAVPKPEAGSLSSGVVTLSVDLDISLEGGKPPPHSSDKILPGDIVLPNPYG